MPDLLNISPSFARDAAHCLHESDFQRALDLCLAGTKTFPTYATGFFILGRSYEAIGRTVESLMAYKQALSILPDNPTLQSLVMRAEEIELLEFQQYAEVQRSRLEAEKSVSPTEQIEEARSEESAIEYLAKRLQDVKRIQPKMTEGEEGSSSRTSPPDYKSMKFVTVTIAEIYAGQEEYAEAIAAYHEIVRQHPEQAALYAKRISEIQQLLDIQQSEKILKGPQNKTPLV